MLPLVGHRRCARKPLQPGNAGVHRQRPAAVRKRRTRMRTRRAAAARRCCGALRSTFSLKLGGFWQRVDSDNNGTMSLVADGNRSADRLGATRRPQGHAHPSAELRKDRRLLLGDSRLGPGLGHVRLGNELFGYAHRAANGRDRYIRHAQSVADRRGDTGGTERLHADARPRQVDPGISPGLDYGGQDRVARRRLLYRGRQRQRAGVRGLRCERRL